MKPVPGIPPTLGDAEAGAHALADELGHQVHLENGRSEVGADLRMDLSEPDYDE